MCPMTGSPTDADKPRRVLVAEDEALIRLDLAEMLREEGYEIVGEAGDGNHGILNLGGGSLAGLAPGGHLLGIGG